MAGNNNSAGISDRALEMIMRDVMDGLMELSLESALSGPCYEFEIIDIEPARKKHRPNDKVATRGKPEKKDTDNKGLAEVVDFPVKRQAWG